MTELTKSYCFGGFTDSKVLAIGHDPRLQRSETLTQYALFADYFFRPKPDKSSERAKYDLAESIFSYIGFLTSYSYTSSQITVTNLCNVPLPHAPRGKTVLIPEELAVNGLKAIESILSQSSIELILPMSLQVNYWLQKLGFFSGPAEFLDLARPINRGLTNEPPYYEPYRNRAFSLLCGKKFETKDERLVIPILHVKQWPLKGRVVEVYKESYTKCVDMLKPVLEKPPA
jgi:hypothetical protein